MSSDDPKKKKQARRPLTGAVETNNNKKRSNTTLADRIAILDYIASNPRLSQSEVATYFQKNGFPTMNQSTISRMVKDEARLRAEAKTTGNLVFKRPRIVEHPAVERALVIWVLQAQTKGIRITGEVLRQKARSFAKLQGLDEKEFLSMSNGWLDGFKARHGMKQYRFHGEAGSVAEDDVTAEQERLKKLTDKYALRDILNMDETGLNDRMPPDRGLATAQFLGKKGNKHRMTYALTTSANGDAFPPLVIGHAKRPRCFGKKSGSDLGFIYYWNKKAWMTGSVFECYLKDLDTQMRKERRHVLLLVDNAPSHIFKPETLTNVTVEFLSPNLTSRIQPNDGGIIKAFKAHYKSLFCKRAIDREEAGEVDLYKIDQLEAMRLADEAWTCVTSTTIRNCWRHVKITSPCDSNGAVIPEPADATQREMQPNNPEVTRVVEELEKDIQTLAKRSIAAGRVMTAEELLEADNGDTEGTLEDEEIMAQALKDCHTDLGLENKTDSDDDEEILEASISAEEGMRHLRELARLFDTQPGQEFRDASLLIPKLLRKLNLKAQEEKKQRKVTNYFIEWPKSP
ncbi:hypothetical protein FRB90_000772, partial [Tulasnella sp. 427]